MDPVIAILITIVIGIISLLVFLGKSKKGSAENQQANEPGNGVQRRNLVAQRGAQRNQRNRLVRGNRNQNAENFIRDDEDDDEERVANRRFDDDDGQDLSDEEREAAEREELRKKIGTKKLAKLEEKAAKKERNEQMLREREEKKERDEKIYQERKKREEEEERLEKEKEEAEKKAKEEQERKEHEEYLKLKAEFSIEEEGQDALLTEEDSQNLLLEFVNFIKNSKIVVLEDLASEFKLKTQDVINRINLVQEMGLLTGVMDDRGKFIYISEEELLKVKTFIEQRGRVNISELAKSSNELINLKPSVKIELIEASSS